MAPHDVKRFKRSEFMDWLERNGATVVEPTNPYEVLRYKMWTDGDASRPSTHIVYRRKNDTLTYGGSSRAHYEAAKL